MSRFAWTCNTKSYYAVISKSHIKQQHKLLGHYAFVQVKHRIGRRVMSILLKYSQVLEQRVHQQLRNGEHNHESFNSVHRHTEYQTRPTPKLTTTQTLPTSSPLPSALPIPSHRSQTLSQKSPSAVHFHLIYEKSSEPMRKIEAVGSFFENYFHNQ